jgi:two-component system nitrogen regulation response regulator GlnG
LVERELFGHLRGAFTGAESDQPGLLARASGGTLLLDEIGDVPLDLQVKLLRAIEYGEIVPVGGSRPVRIDVRFLAATNRPLGQMIAEGGFREDLFFRLSVFPIRVPALRERPEDIPPLVHHFARLARSGAPAPTAEALAALRSRPWPGNVRELRNAIEYASITARGEAIRPEHLPALAPAPADLPSSPPALERLVSEWAGSQLADPAEPADLYERLLALIEPPLFLAALDHCRQNRLAAQRLGIHRETLRQKLRRHGLADPPADR